MLGLGRSAVAGRQGGDDDYAALSGEQSQGPGGQGFDVVRVGVDGEDAGHRFPRGGGAYRCGGGAAVGGAGSASGTGGAAATSIGGAARGGAGGGGPGGIAGGWRRGRAAAM